MANLGNFQDPTNGERSQGGGPLEPGEYVLNMVKSGMRDAKSGRGKYLECEFVVYEGAWQGRHVWTTFNLVNDSRQAAEIAWRDFNALKHACGKLNVQDSSELHGIPFRAYIGFEKKNRDRNAIKSYKPYNAGTSAARPASAHNAGGGIESRGAWNRARA